MKPVEKAHPTWFEARLPRADECCVRQILDRLAVQRASQVFAIHQDDSQWTYAETRTVTRTTAAGLQKLGVAPGDVVLTWLPNSAAHLRTWMATNYLGATYAPLNVSYRGGLLAHAIANSGAKVMVAHADLIPRLAEIDLKQLEKVIVLGGAAPQLPGVQVLPASSLDGDGEALVLGDAPQPWDIAAIIYTSGTTGPSKGVRVPYAQLWTLSVAHFGFMTPDDRMFLFTPLCHISPISGVFSALVMAASVVVYESFKGSEFWNQVRRTGATTVPGMGLAIQEFLAKMPERPDDGDNPLRMVNVRAPSESVMAFAKRFRFDYFGSYSMSETSVIVATDVNSTVRDSCGRPRSGLEVRLVDENDVEVPVGAVGELILRTEHPWTINAGYHNDPVATARAWRNGWFHTGDALRRDADGNYFFVDRFKDSIRRRGENISSYEIELAALAYPGVQDVAAIPVPGAFGDDEVLLVLSPMPGKTVDPMELTQFLIPRMAHYMVPRYIRILPELPKTPSAKVQKAGLRAEGLTPETWDREAAGLVLKRERFEPVA